MTAGRPMKFLTSIDFYKKHHILLPYPPICVCGTRNHYRYGLNHNEINAVCNNCNAWLVYSKTNKKWLFVNPSIR